MSKVGLATCMPGVTVVGRELAKKRRLPYLCNGYACYYTSLSLLALLHFTRLWRFEQLYDNFGKYMTAAVIIGDLQALYWYLHAFVFGRVGRMSGYFIYDYFVGVILNPRIENVDIKMVMTCVCGLDVIGIGCRMSFALVVTICPYSCRSGQAV